MNRKRAARSLPALFLGLVVHCAVASAAVLQPGSSLWLEGDSTLHPYSSTATAMELALSWNGKEGEPLAAAVEARLPMALTLTIPVLGLQSAHKGLDRNLRKALRADKFPDIVFAMTDYRVEKGSAAAAVSAQGELSVAGVRKPQTIRAALRVRDGRVILEGQQPLLMTDFEVKPPALLFGAVKAADRVVIKFHLELEQAARASPGSGK